MQTVPVALGVQATLLPADVRLDPAVTLMLAKLEAA
jgi:hypothetical protein